MATAPKLSKDALTQFKPQHDSFVGIDSDGCVFDSMEAKQKLCFHPVIIAHWGLQEIEKELRQAAEFVNLYSKWRGQNRFIALVKVFELLAERPDVVATGVQLPSFEKTNEYLASGVPLGNPSLEEAVSQTKDPELTALLEWSNLINEKIADTLSRIPPFEGVLESFRKINQSSDAICVSQTPCEALIKEWAENDITDFVALIAGQEMGTKTEHLALAAIPHYPPDRILMIGDAPGDRKAAKANDALFYPINPAHEVASWQRFYEEAYDRFLGGTYAGAYQAERIDEFESLLPDTPSWSS